MGALIAVLVMASGASAAVSTDQTSYSPGSTVTISGDNSDNAGYAAGETVDVNVNEPSGGTLSCNATADSNGAWSCQVTLPSEGGSAIGTYDYTASGETSGVTQSGQFTDSGCNGANSVTRPTDNNVEASYTSSNGTATYTIKSTNENPSSGVPGLIEYCVYPSPLPDGAQASYDSWGSGIDTSGGFFDFERPNGNPTNLPLDGITRTLGTATWSGAVPSGQLILLHINDPAECAALGEGNSTCFVTPGTITNAAKDLKVSKTATPSFTRTYTWGIAKSVDQTSQNIADGGSAKFNYTVNVTHDNGTDGKWQVAGVITVKNPNGADFTGVNVTDSSDQGGSCTVDNGSNVTIPANSSKDFTYTCKYSSDPGNSVTDTGKATWGSGTYNTPDKSATGQANADFTSVSPTITDGSVNVTDTLGGGLGKVSYTDPSPNTFMYSHTVSGDQAGTCTKHDNTATFTTSDTGTTGSDSQTVQVCVGADMTVKKDATPSFTRTYNWGIAKSVDKTVLDPGGTANYTVTATEKSVSDSAWQVTGTITVHNPNDWEAVALTGVKDAIDNGGSCSVSGDTAQTIAAGADATLTYTCTYSSAPSPASGTNTATATWDKAAASSPDGSANGSATADFGSAAPTKTVNKTITVTDPQANPSTLGTATATDTQPYTVKQFTYSKKFAPPTSGCAMVNNTATIVETGQSASASVKNCNSGALTMGFWQNKNGQGIITGGASTAGVCNSGTWLRTYAPFQDLSATATCSQVATYVTNIIKAANASGSAMNAMLKAQMLATSLDVYFSDPSLGGNKISAPAPIGGLTIDLTHICKMVDSSSGGTCSGTSENASSAFGAGSLTVSQMLAYAASKSNSGGSTWYGNVKATQQLAKDAFDSTNNQVASSP